MTALRRLLFGIALGLAACNEPPPLGENQLAGDNPVQCPGPHCCCTCAQGANCAGSLLNVNVDIPADAASCTDYCNNKAGAGWQYCKEANGTCP
jgi:hypothetical protein